MSGSRKASTKMTGGESANLKEHFVTDMSLIEMVNSKEDPEMVL